MTKVGTTIYIWVATTGVNVTTVVEIRMDMGEAEEGQVGEERRREQLSCECKSASIVWKSTEVNVCGERRAEGRC